MATRYRGVVVWRSIAVLGFFLAAGCGNSDPQGTESVEPAPTAAKASAEPFVPADACALLTKSEVEGFVGKSVMEPQKEAMANLVTCSFGDPDSPKIGGRAMSQVVSLAVFTGQEGTYYAGPVAQAKDGYEMTRKNAASDEAVSGLGESAYWDNELHTLSAYKGKYFLTTTVEAGAGGRTG